MHGPNDYHPDHRAISQACKVAAGFRMPVLYVGTFVGIDFQLTHYVDITPVFSRKCAAIDEH